MKKIGIYILFIFLIISLVQAHKNGGQDVEVGPFLLDFSWKPIPPMEKEPTTLLFEVLNNTGGVALWVQRKDLYFDGVVSFQIMQKGKVVDKVENHPLNEPIDIVFPDSGLFDIQTKITLIGGNTFEHTFQTAQMEKPLFQKKHIPVYIIVLAILGYILLELDTILIFLGIRKKKEP